MSDLVLGHIENQVSCPRCETKMLTTSRNEYEVIGPFVAMSLVSLNECLSCASSVKTTMPVCLLVR